jgi:hypothetical protein
MVIAPPAICLNQFYHHCPHHNSKQFWSLLLRYPLGFHDAIWHPRARIQDIIKIYPDLNIEQKLFYHVARDLLFPKSHFPSTFMNLFTSNHLIALQCHNMLMP